MADVTSAERLRWDDVGILQLTHPDRQTTLLFSRAPGPRTVQLPAIADSALWINMWGDRQLLRPVDGIYTIELAPAPCTQFIGEYCMIGGETIYLVQNLVSFVTPTTTPQPLFTTPQISEKLPDNGGFSAFWWLFLLLGIARHFSLVYPKNQLNLWIRWGKLWRKSLFGGKRMFQ